MNADEGAYQLSHLYDQLIQRMSSDDDVTKMRSRSAIITVSENILRCETSLLKIVSVDFSREILIHLTLTTYMNPIAYTECQLLCPVPVNHPHYVVSR